MRGAALRGRGTTGRFAPRVDRSGGGTGDYFAAMTDLMLGLLFIFIIMLMAFALNLHDAEHRMSHAAQALTESDLARREMLHDIATALHGRLPVTIDEENGTLQLGDDVLFPQGSADAYPEALPKLRLLADALDTVLPCYAVADADRPAGPCGGKRQGRLEAVYIEGHTDATPIRTSRFQNNWDLSAARASQTFLTLVEDDPALGRLKNDRNERLIGVSGYGENRPIDDSGTPAGLQKNRRIELRFIMVSPKTPELDRLLDQVRARAAP